MRTIPIIEPVPYNSANVKDDLYKDVRCPYCNSYDEWGVYDSDDGDGNELQHEYAHCDGCNDTFTLKISREVVAIEAVFIPKYDVFAAETSKCGKDIYCTECPQTKAGTLIKCESELHGCAYFAGMYDSNNRIKCTYNTLTAMREKRERNE